MIGGATNLGRRRDPAVTTLLVVVGVAVVAGFLRWATRQGAETDLGLAKSDAFAIWIGLASIAVVTFASLTRGGFDEISHTADDLHLSRRSITFYRWMYPVFAAVVLGLLRVGGGGGPKIPIAHWPTISLTLVVLGAVAAYPWVMLVWALHSTLKATRNEMALLLYARRQIVKVITSLLAIVTAAVLLSGALRAAVVPDYVTDEDFPAEGVLMYGAFFTAALSATVVPLLVSWRRAAFLLVDEVHPVGISSTADDVAARDRLLSSLNVNGSLFTFPATLTALLAPLITSLLAVWIPQLGS